MIENFPQGNALVERLSHEPLGRKGLSAFTSRSKTVTYILGHGLGNIEWGGDRGWTLETYDPETGWALAREMNDRRRASHFMRRLRDVSAQDLAFALHSIARMVDEDGEQKRSLLFEVLYHRVFFRAQQGHSLGQAPDPERS